MDETAADKLTEAERRLRACVETFDEGNPPSHGDLLKVLAEYDRRGAELERLRVVHEADTQLLRDVLEQNQLLRARDEAAQAVDQAWREPLGIARARLRQNWPALGSALDAQARTREDG